MTIVVTGGAGFIGSNFIFHMLKAHPNYRIICLDKLTYAGNLSTLKNVMGNPNFRFIKLDICIDITFIIISFTAIATKNKSGTIFATASIAT